jgi:protein-tyrosine phosphatase
MDGLVKQDLTNPFVFNLMGSYDDLFLKDWITKTICIGQAEVSYEGFNVVVNANFPPNRIKHGKVGYRHEKLGKSDCTLYLVGLYDDDSEDLDHYLNCLLPSLSEKYKENPNTTFLFHCFAGKSRSVVLALAFMVEVVGMTFEEAFTLIKKHRPIVEPRPLFIETLCKWYGINK